MNITPLALTLGDAAGIGPEIVIKLHLGGLPAPCVVYGDAGALRRAVAALEAPLRVIELTDVSTLATYAHEVGCLFVRPTYPTLPENLPLGRVDARAGQSAYDALCLAIDDAMLGKVSAIVTAPLNKEAMHAAGLDFPGHTEILAQRSGTPYVAMMLVNDRLRVILATIHIALSEVSPTLTTALELRTIELAQQACQAMGIASPRIGVAGLNPHAGEHGKFGREDLDIIAPAIAQAQARGIKASGPWPGDTLFMRARLGEFDICVAQYHDQGLIPIKYLGIDQGVNITVGLPFVRTSVDHGTAFDIAGKGIADPSSLREAFEMARTMLHQKK
ncbi:MAG: 4-hydroxythreonine-4-phosphate dehydrogenase PdxA [Burkholderiaceae bacterium]|nr:4-hydroxythreonine-4-phosphate dehydrogenase PdxA [Burkholderiaceae bacterium]